MNKTRRIALLCAVFLAAAPLSAQQQPEQQQPAPPKKATQQTPRESESAPRRSSSGSFQMSVGNTRFLTADELEKIKKNNADSEAVLKNAAERFAKERDSLKTLLAEYKKAPRDDTKKAILDILSARFDRRISQRQAILDEMTVKLKKDKDEKDKQLDRQFEQLTHECSESCPTPCSQKFAAQSTEGGFLHFSSSSANPREKTDPNGNRPQTREDIRPRIQKSEKNVAPQPPQNTPKEQR